MQSIKLGADPEGFLSLGGRFISADGLIPGNKKEPFKVERGAVQVDGMAVEFNIDAVETEDEFEKNMSTVISQLDEIVKKVDKDIQINWTPFVEFDKEVWDRSSNDSKVLGCDPDFNVSGEVNENPSMRIEGTRYRTAAGHIHIGWTSNQDVHSASHFDNCLYLSKYFFENRIENFVPVTTEEYRRLEYYGLQGSFRPKSYGVELRGPSNLWVRNEKSRRNMFNVVRNTMKIAVGM